VSGGVGLAPARGQELHHPGVNGSAIGGCFGFVATLQGNVPGKDE